MRLGVVGTGGIAARHLTALQEDGIGGFQVVAHLSRREDTAARAAQRFGGQACTEVEAFLAQRPDCVLVTLPPSQHGALEQALVAARLPFLVEKPLGLDAEVPAKIFRHIEERRLVAAVGYNWRALDTLDRVRELLAERAVEMVIGRFHIGTPVTSWWRFKAQSGGQMLEQACHLVDLARHLVGEGEVLGAAGSFGRLPDAPDGDVAGASAALLRFGRVPALISATCLLPGGPGPELRLICAGREIVITLAEVAVVENGKSTRYATTGNCYARQDRRFFEAVRTVSPSSVFSTYGDALQTHRICLEISTCINSPEL